MCVRVCVRVWVRLAACVMVAVGVVVDVVVGGVAIVVVTVVDEERDEVEQIMYANITNRAPLIEIRSMRTEARVEHPITLYAFANDTDSEDPFPGVVDVFWPDAQCKEGYYTKVCTTTALTEGYHTFTAIGVDDDSTATETRINILFTNIAPHSTIINLYNEAGIISSDDQKICLLYTSDAADE